MKSMNSKIKQIDRLKYADAKLALKSRNFEKAADLFQRHYTREKNRSDAGLSLVYGNVLMRLEKYEDALAVFAEGQRRNVSSPVLAYKTGFVYERLGQYEPALRMYDVAVGLEPNNAEYRYRRATANSRLGNRQEAAADAESAIAIDSSDTRYHDLLRQASYVLPLWRQLEILENGFKLHKNSPTWSRSLAAAAFKMKRWTQSFSAYKNLLLTGNLNSKDAIYACVAGMRAGETNLVEFEAVAKKGSKDNRVRAEGIARLFEKVGFRDEAISRYDLELDRSPREELFYGRGLALMRQYKWEQSASDLYKAVGLSPNNREYNYRLAFVLEKRGNYADAAAAYQASIPTTRISDYRRYRSVYCYYKAGLIEEAASLVYDPSVGSVGTSEHGPTVELQFKLDRDNSETNRHITAHIRRSLEAVKNGIRPLTDCNLAQKLALNYAQCGMAAEFEKYTQIALNRSSAHPESFLRQAAQAAIQLNMLDLGVSLFVESRLFQKPLSFDRASVLKNTKSITVAKYLEFQQTRPIDDLIVLLEMNHGATLSGNILPILREMLERADLNDYRFYVVYNAVDLPQEFRDNERVVFVRRESDQYLRLLATAKWLINDNTFPPYFSREDDQCYLNTWHGTPIKSLGKNIIGGVMDHRNASRNLLHVTHLCVPNIHTGRVLIEDNDIAHIFPGAMYVTGAPATGRTLQVAGDRQMGDKVIRMMEGFDRDKPTILYAPTWRGDLATRVTDMSAIVETLKVLTQSGLLNVVFRGHPLDEANLADFDFPDVLVAPSSVPTNDLLGIVDLLVTDYSSVAFDFSALNRPIILHGYDLEEYSAKRGFSLVPDELTPNVTRTAEELRRLIAQFEAGEMLSCEFGALHRSILLEPNPVDAARKIVDLFFFGDSEHVERPDISGYRRCKEMVFFQGSFMPNGITASFQSLSSALVKEGIGVTVLLEPGAVYSDPQRVERFESLDASIAKLARVGIQSVTAEERWVIDRFNHVNRFESDEMEEIYWNAFSREAKRMLGDSHFDASICFEGYARFWMAVMATVRSGVRGAYLHNDMIGEAHTRFPYLEGVARQYSRFDILASVSESVHDSNRDNLPVFFGGSQDRFVCIPNLIDPENIIRLGEESFDHPDAIADWMSRQKFVFVNSARLSPEKGQNKLLRAFKHLVDEGMDVSLILIGQGPLRESLGREVNGLNLSSRVRFAGYVANPFPIVRRADAFVLSSDYEGQGLVVLESLALGVDVVSTDIVGPRSILESGAGLLVDNSVSALADGMRQLAEGWAPRSRFSFETYVDGALSDFRKAFIR